MCLISMINVLLVSSCPAHKKKKEKKNDLAQSQSPANWITLHYHIKNIKADLQVSMNILKH